MFFITIAIIIGVTVVPVMFAARLVGAQKTGFGSALLAVIILGILSPLIGKLLIGQPQVVAFAVSSIVGAAILSVVLSTTFLRGLAISAIVVVIQIVLTLVIASAIFSVAA
jgi:hypothetical protein